MGDDVNRRLKVVLHVFDEQGGEVVDPQQCWIDNISIEDLRKPISLKPLQFDDDMKALGENIRRFMGQALREWARGPRG